jgi:hypothetical protein
MNDRELLERAAKAAGIVVIRSRLQDPLNKDMLVEFSARNRGQIAGQWNPLADDGDALRLAVKLEIAINPFAGKTVVAHNESGRMGHEKWDCWDDDPFAATRRAIVRAAAALAEEAK